MINLNISTDYKNQISGSPWIKSAFENHANFSIFHYGSLSVLYLSVTSNRIFLKNLFFVSKEIARLTRSTLRCVGPPQRVSGKRSSLTLKCCEIRVVARRILIINFLELWWFKGNRMADIFHHQKSNSDDPKLQFMQTIEDFLLKSSLKTTLKAIPIRFKIQGSKAS